MDKEITTDSWDGFVETFFKPEYLKKVPDSVFIAFVRTDTKPDGKARLLYNVQYEGQKFVWDVNKTNMRILRKLGIDKPKDLVEKQVWFQTTRVRNPTTNQMVDSLIVDRVE